MRVQLWRNYVRFYLHVFSGYTYRDCHIMWQMINVHDSHIWDKWYWYKSFFQKSSDIFWNDFWWHEYHIWILLHWQVYPTLLTRSFEHYIWTLRSFIYRTVFRKKLVHSDSQKCSFCKTDGTLGNIRGEKKSTSLLLQEKFIPRSVIPSTFPCPKGRELRPDLQKPL